MKKICFFMFLISTVFLLAGDKGEKISINLGFSYVGTTGNAENRNFGLDFNFKKPLKDWGIEGGFSYIRVEERDVLNSERIKANLKGNHVLNGRISYFALLDWERDRFSGFDSRTGFSTGIDYKVFSSEKDLLLAEVGLSYVTEEYVSSQEDEYFAGLLGLKYEHNWTEKSNFKQRFLYIPNFEESSKWRGEAETAVQAGLTDKMALKFSFLLRYQNRPLEGFEKTDTITTISLILNF